MESDLCTKDTINMWDNNNNDIELKKCPFCGGTPLQAEDNDLEMFIECDNCKVNIYRCQKSPPDGKYDYVKACREAWNRREYDDRG